MLLAEHGCGCLGKGAEKRVFQCMIDVSFLMLLYVECILQCGFEYMGFLITWDFQYMDPQDHQDAPSHRKK